MISMLNWRRPISTVGSPRRRLPLDREGLARQQRLVDEEIPA